MLNVDGKWLMILMMILIIDVEYFDENRYGKFVKWLDFFVCLLV